MFIGSAFAMEFNIYIDNDLQAINAASTQMWGGRGGGVF